MIKSVKRLLSFIAVAVIATGLALTWKFLHRGAVPVPDEKAAAMALLAQKLTGPEYFDAPVAGIQEEGGPWIDPREIDRQKDRVIAERKFDADQRARLDRLIAELSEPQPARMVGGYRVQLARLNLALDTLRK
jgi:hypothetical protein